MQAASSISHRPAPTRVRAPHKRAAPLVRWARVLGGHDGRKTRGTPCNGLKRRAGGMTKLGPVHKQFRLWLCERTCVAMLALMILRG
jgi:hypothetical protein